MRSQPRATGIHVTFVGILYAVLLGFMVANKLWSVAAVFVFWWFTLIFIELINTGHQIEDYLESLDKKKSNDFE